MDVATRPGGDVWRVDYDESGIASLIAQLQTLNSAAVLLEATGGIEVPLVSALAAASLPVVVVNPRQVRDFAKATGRLAKTDALDARVLAQFAEVVRPPLRPLRDADTQNHNELTTRRNQLITMLIAEKNRLERGTGSVHPRIEAHINWLEKELKDLDKELRETLLRSPVWRQKDDLLRSVPGVGESGFSFPPGIFAGTGRTGPQADSRPRWSGPHQQGQRDYERQTHRMGRPVAGEGDALHGNAGSHSLQPCGSGSSTRDSLRPARPSKVALVACMRKLLTILNSMVKSGQHWDPQTITP